MLYLYFLLIFAKIIVNFNNWTSQNIDLINSKLDNIEKKVTIIFIRQENIPNKSHLLLNNLLKCYTIFKSMSMWY